MSGVNVQHGVGSKTESLGVQLADLPPQQDVVSKLRRLQDRMDKRIDDLIARKARAEAVIDQIPDARNMYHDKA